MADNTKVSEPEIKAVNKITLAQRLKEYKRKPLSLVM